MPQDNVQAAVEWMISQHIIHLLDCLWGELYGSINAAEISEFSS